MQNRGLYTILLGLVSITGNALLVSNSNAGVHYAGCFLVAMVLYVVAGLPLASVSSNSPRYGKLANATGSSADRRQRCWGDGTIRESHVTLFLMHIFADANM